MEHSGCTVFRFPLRRQFAKSQICDMTFSSADIEAMDATFLSVDFRMFLHSALLFTKHLREVKVTGFPLPLILSTWEYAAIPVRFLLGVKDR
mgnify:FL=1